MSLLTVIQGVTNSLSLTTPTVVSGSTDRQVIQLLALANESGRQLARERPWQALTEEATFVTVAADAQPAAIPADFDRFVPNTFFNRTTRRPLTGPITSREWQWYKAQPILATVYLAFRQRTGQFLIAPPPPVGQNIFYEYVSLNWAKSVGGVSQPAYVLDTDLSFLDETLIQLGLKWRFLKARGLDYAEDFITYEKELEKAKSRDGGNTMLTLSPRPVDINRVNIPEGSFGH